MLDLLKLGIDTPLPREVEMGLQGHRKNCERFDSTRIYLSLAIRWYLAVMLLAFMGNLAQSKISQEWNNRVLYWDRAVAKLDDPTVSEVMSLVLSWIAPTLIGAYFVARVVHFFFNAILLDPTRDHFSLKRRHRLTAEIAQSIREFAKLHSDGPPYPGEVERLAWININHLTPLILEAWRRRHGKYIPSHRAVEFDRYARLAIARLRNEVTRVDIEPGRVLPELSRLLIEIATRHEEGRGSLLDLNETHDVEPIEERVRSWPRVKLVAFATLAILLIAVADRFLSEVLAPTAGNLALLVSAGLVYGAGSWAFRYIKGENSDDAAP